MDKNPSEPQQLSVWANAIIVLTGVGPLLEH
jgi:hypothetical protein